MIFLSLPSSQWQRSFICCSSTYSFVFSVPLQIKFSQVRTNKLRGHVPLPALVVGEYHDWHYDLSCLKIISYPRKRRSSWEKRNKRGRSTRNISYSRNPLWWRKKELVKQKKRCGEWCLLFIIKYENDNVTVHTMVLGAKPVSSTTKQYGVVVCLLLHVFHLTIVESIRETFTIVQTYFHFIAIADYDDTHSTMQERLSPFEDVHINERVVGSLNMEWRRYEGHSFSVLVLKQCPLCLHRTK